MTHLPSPSSFVTTILTEVSLDRLQKAVTALADGSVTITLTKHTEAEISAYVANGKGTSYGVTLTDGKSFCNCGDRMHRANLTHCKHAAALALFALRAPTTQPVEAVPVPEEPFTVSPIVVSPCVHLQWRDSLTCCGVVDPPRVGRYPWSSSLLNAPDTCKACVAIHTAGYNNHMLHLVA